MAKRAHTLDSFLVKKQRQHKNVLWYSYSNWANKTVH